jgi:hypothetical protein
VAAAETSGPWEVESMSTHDRGTFGLLLAQLKAGGARHVEFRCNLTVDGDDGQPRWAVAAYGAELYGRTLGVRSGRTGEEALRALVEAICKQ